MPSHHLPLFSNSGSFLKQETEEITKLGEVSVLNHSSPNPFFSMSTGTCDSLKKLFQALGDKYAIIETNDFRASVSLQIQRTNESSGVFRVSSALLQRSPTWTVPRSDQLSGLRIPLYLKQALITWVPVQNSDQIV